MHYLIDGYNLLHVTDVFTTAVGPKSLPKLHSVFLDFLAQTLGDDASRTTVVFDAKGKRATSRRTTRHAGITVHYASKEEDADSLIAELLLAHHSPRQLTVVSSDHQVQRAAKRRRAKAIDSDTWYLAIRRRAAQATPTAIDSSDKPQEHAELLDANWWLAQFDPELLRQMNQESQPHTTEAPVRPKRIKEPKGEEPAEEEETKERKTSQRGSSLDVSHPFPPEYIAEIIQEIADETPRAAKRTPKDKRRR